MNKKEYYGGKHYYNLADFLGKRNTVLQKGYYSDYITNPEKRFRTVTEEALGDDWWSVYLKHM